MSPTGIDTTEFTQVFNVETDRLIRRRLFWFTLVMLVLNGGAVVFAVTVTLLARSQGAPIAETFYDGTFGTPNPPMWRVWMALVLLALWFAAYGFAFLSSLKKSLSARFIIHLTMGLIVYDGLEAVGLRIAGATFANLGLFVFVHFIACCVFPWRPRQAMIPILIVLPVSLVSKLTIEGGSVVPQIFLTAFVAAMTTPGVLVSWWKHSQRLQTTSNKFLTQRYGMLRQELAYARQIHEAMFPEPKLDGGVRFNYRYEPMRQIGGDYLHAHVVRNDDGTERLSLVILDVTGHGIPAALTVNRLYGEIDLRFADDPNLDPGALLRHLNRYVNLTLASHSIYATALCLRVDSATGEVTYASGGHPPAFLRGSDGTISELGSTTFVLGACRDEDFDARTVSVKFGSGDAIVAYTDGATEARAPSGQMLRIDGLRSALVPGPVTPEPGDWPEQLLRLVANHRGGSVPEDDTLLVEIYCPVCEDGHQGGSDAATEAGSHTRRASEPDSAPAAS
ncbi:MAG: PP2C family protein-serine/threonine phosphatase [Phycisphaerales bacterium JB040]